MEPELATRCLYDKVRVRLPAGHRMSTIARSALWLRSVYKCLMATRVEGYVRTLMRDLLEGAAEGGPIEVEETDEVQPRPITLPGQSMQLSTVPQAVSAISIGRQALVTVALTPTVVEQSAASPNVEEAPDFFSAEGLAMNNDSIRSSQHTLKPSEAHSHLKPFLRDNYIFDGPSREVEVAETFISETLVEWKI
ncbi:hypothetical protein DENSPDRAFT_854917 [Dentipellis sp. KUC8613]|nr:hypothetical protein DENSPDRAFT_854917 [Dentipellis sp. KUC8613]